MFGESKTIDKAFPALWADIDPTIAMHSVMAFKSNCVWEIFCTEFACERPEKFVEADVALQCSGIVENSATFPTLISQQMPANESQRL